LNILVGRVPTRPRWWVAAALVLIAFVGVLGRTLTFA